MSADLLAAFGNVAVSGDDYHDRTRTTSTATYTSQIPQAGSTTSIGHAKELTKGSSQPLWQRDEADAEVLFDASVDEDDEFGDFEDANPVAIRGHTPVSIHGGIDLLGINEPLAESNSWATSIARTTPTQPIDLPGLLDTTSPSEIEVPQALPDLDNDDSEEDWGTFEDADIVQSSTKATPVPVGRIPERNETRSGDLVHEDDNEEEWDTFEDGPSPPPPPQTKNWTKRPTPKVTRQNYSQDAPAGVCIPSSATIQQRPTNVPPPSTLLQLLPKTYEVLSSTTTSPLGPQANGILQTYLTTARIISGRQHRWKRDTVLIQSTRISEIGGSKKTSGMKLTALDKSLSVKEDQEVLEAVAAWSRASHVLNGIMVKANVKRPQGQLSAQMKVRVETGPGVLGAKEVCAVCGLRRDERVIGIDERVDDIFGEFWVEHWGHKACYDFWYRFREMLDQR